MKRKTLTLTLSLLACFALIGVGFASWVITKTNSSAEGNFVVELVTESELNVSMKWQKVNADNTTTDLEVNVNPSINYTPLTSQNAGPSWLKAQDSTEESLKFNLVITVTNKNENAFFATTDDLNFVGNVSANTVYNTANTNGYVGKMPTFDSGDENNTVDVSVALSDDKKTITITCKFVFTWGEAFGGVNPMTYYKNETAAIGTEGHKDTLEALQADANEKLTALHTALSGQQFQLTLAITLK